jgi:hypothetical protein
VVEKTCRRGNEFCEVTGTEEYYGRRRTLEGPEEEGIDNMSKERDVVPRSDFGCCVILEDD